VVSTFQFLNTDNIIAILIFVAGVINSLIDCKDELLKFFNLIRNKKFFFLNKEKDE
jgi:hypothetical protein